MSKFNNRFLFSDYYLEEILPGQEEFTGPGKILSDSFGSIKRLFKDKRKELPQRPEASLEEEFIRPILDILGHLYEVQPPLPTSERVNHPDYAFFASSEEKLFAVNHLGKKEFWTRAVAVGDAKSWERSLDKKLSGGGDHFDSLNPSYQIDSYLRDSELKWGILTNGRYWRLYNRDTSYKLGVYYEIDLQKLIEKGSVDDFKYFYLFFRKEAFLPKGASFLDRTYQGSIDYAKEVGERLKENVYEALRLLCEGCLKYPENQLGTDNLEVIHDNALVFLYRLLFIFYAESLGLLPVERNHKYRELYSIRAIKLDIAGRKDKGDNFSTTEARYCDALHQLFTIINLGNEMLDVPAYNGGLFDPEKHPFLDAKGRKGIKVSDYYLADIIDLLARSKEKDDERPAFVDYRSLAVQHLGSIYEGLLEYKVKYDSGKIILETDRGERKATGSYYTPDYIVNYIVENTLGPLCKEIDERLKCQIKELEEKVKKSRGASRETYQADMEKLKRSYDDEALKLKVLDPAMGSGHFLVRAAEYLAEEIATSPYGHDEEAPEDETAVDYWKRKVVEHCIYGVDLNPLAVELAKLSLWLSTVSRGKPLSFLDHHLRCGNSLIGAKLKDLNTLPQKKKVKKAVNVQQLAFIDESKLTQDISLLMGDFKNIKDRPSDTVEQVKEKEHILNDLIEKRRSRYIKQADLWTSTFFGNEMDDGIYYALVEELQGAKGKGLTLSRTDAKAYFEKLEAIKAEKRFFHWELEFPEVFFDEYGRRLENSGFDVVMGNPPYVNVVELDKYLSEYEKPYFKMKYVSAAGAFDIFVLFVQHGLELTASKKFLGMIVPNKYLSAEYSINLRKWLLDFSLVSLADYSNVPVFNDAAVYPVVPIYQKTSPEDNLSFDVYKVTPGGDTVKSYKLSQLRNDLLAKTPDLIWSFIIQPSATAFQRILDISLPFKDIVDVSGAAAVSEAYEIKELLVEKAKLSKATSGGIPFLVSGNIDRYDNSWNIEPVQYIKQSYHQPLLHLEKDKLSERRLEQIRSPKIIISGMGLVLEAYWDILGEYAPAKSTVVVYNSKRQYSLGYLCSILNTKISSFIYNTLFKTLSLSGGYMRFGPPQIERLPIRRIAFVTPEEKRKRLLEKAKELYNAGDIKQILSSITERLQKRHGPNPELVKRHNAEPLNKEFQIPEGALWEQSDVVHDFLAFLAEQMIELNKEKQAEIKGFLAWLEREIGAEVDDLTGKSYLKNYIGDYQKNEAHLSLDTFLEILKKNKNKLSVNISSRTFIENLEREYNASIKKLLPIKEKLKQTDWLIDQIVYKLYGLMDEEIKIVERSNIT